MTPTSADGRFAGPLSAQIGMFADADTLADALRLHLVDPAESLDIPHDAEAWSEGGVADRATLLHLLDLANAEAATPWPQPLASLAARVHDDGDRDRWEQRAFERQRRLSRAVVAALATDDDHPLEAVLDGVMLLCEQSSWCWPAHDDVRDQTGHVLADVERPFLDLGAGEVVGQLAALDHVLGQRLERRYPGTRARIRLEAKRKIIDPFVSRRDWHWIGLDGDVHNWNPWIHGNVLLAALRLLDDPRDAALRVHVVDLVIEGLDRYLVSLPDDGAIDEGYAYWWNGACRAIEAVDALDHALGRRLRIAQISALRETVAFPHRMHLGAEWYLNLADGQARPSADQPWHALHRAARAVGDSDALAHAAAHRTPDSPAASEHEGLPRLLRGITDRAWVDALPQASPLPAEVWLPSTEVLVARETAGDSRGVCLAVKGGHNGEHHNHNDVGSFVVASDGVPVIVDAGRPTYTLQTFGPERYSIWTMQSGWHNTPVLAGSEQRAGSDAAARDVHRTSSPDASRLSLDVLAAYPDTEFTSWHRTAALDRSTATIVVEDHWTTGDDAGAPDGTSVRMLIAGEVELGEGTALITPLDGASPLRVGWTPAAPATVVVRELDDPLLTDVWGPRIRRLDLDVAGRDGLTVVIEQARTTEGRVR
ncbi:heparinase II/III family protein [Marisediminicola sp. LYQ134]|uniref:heparinase II/III domain-containing protein n=1 Tax=Marisediminicola sp. LYQ134 TaxID=3391061 RepID=UPI0039832116